MKNKIIYLSFLLLFSCSSNREKTIVIEEVEDDTTVTENNILETIYYSIPSPLETTILLKDKGPKFSKDLLFPTIELNNISQKQRVALLLGVLSTDLNYAMIYEKQNETNQLLEQVIDLAKLINLSTVINDETKNRIDQNINNKDSMQIIISDTFWEIDNSLKSNENHDLAALLVTGGWIQGLYLASGLSVLDSTNKAIEDIIADQKIVHENLINLATSFEYNSDINDYIITPLVELEEVFDLIEIQEVDTDTTTIIFKDNEYELGNYITFNFRDGDLKLIHSKINLIRENILTQIL